MTFPVAMAAVATAACGSSGSTGACSPASSCPDASVEAAIAVEAPAEDAALDATSDAAAALDAASDHASGEAIVGVDASACAANLQTDPNNCGACQRGCLGGACVGGACQPVLLAQGQYPYWLAASMTLRVTPASHHGGDERPSMARKPCRVGASDSTCLGPLLAGIAADVG